MNDNTPAEHLDHLDNKDLANALLTFMERGDIMEAIKVFWGRPGSLPSATKSPEESP